MEKPAARLPPEPTNVFQMPAYESLQLTISKAVLLLFKERRYAEAEQTLRKLVGRYPNWPVHHYNLAAALARQGKQDDALERLYIAIRHGFKNRRVIEKDPDFDTLRSLPRYREVLAELEQQNQTAGKKWAPSIAPKLVQSGQAPVDESNTVWERRSNTLFSAFRFEKPPAAQPIAGGSDDISKRLNLWYDKGEAAGNHGDLYDNRDDGHSRLAKSAFPQIAHVDYGAMARAAGVHYGLNSYFLFNAVTFGNSSTAVTGGLLWRSQARLALTNPASAASTYRQYMNNHLYVYPEHSDHDRGKGDLLPANTPYMIISQGSSGSDQPFLRAIGATLAAFRPDVKAFLRRNRLLMPTVQNILRYGQKTVGGDSDYLSSKAHPTVFSSSNLDVSKMIERANALRTDWVPPVVKLAVLEESGARSGIDFFAPAGISEILFNTPSAVARLVRSTRYEKRMVVDAGGTKDPNGRSLIYRWVVLRGDTDRIKISRLNKTGSKVELRVPWHERRAVPHSPELETDRVDIGVFAYNGEHFSAPSFITFFYPADQERLYNEAGRIRQVDYNSPTYRQRYVDPALFPARDWRDIYEYDDAGSLVGWKRFRGGGIQSFTRHGLKVVERDDAERPSLAERVRYDVRPTKSGRPAVVQESTGEFVTYRYKGSKDRLGIVGPAEKNR
ncbi:MAG: tetratricopeptide repeat protein [Alphaproteobacteria bacterium]|nr:tetratricopeptide repeat protein [Alphaproteobacteria bacterium]